MRWVALLRGVNVGGKRILKMDLARAAISSAGLGEVSSYIQSGNLLFASDDDPVDLEGRIEQALKGVTGWPVPVIVRSQVDIERLAGLEDLRHVPDDDKDVFVSFAKRASEHDLSDWSPKRDVEVLATVGLDVVWRRHNLGPAPEPPSNYVEAKLKVPVTARRWGVVRAIDRLLRE